MSKYSGVCDFRDILQIYFKDDFELFTERTGGNILVGNKSISIRKPEELIEYYPYKVSSIGTDLDNNKVLINLFKISYIDNKLNEYEKINSKYSVDVFPTNDFYIMKNDLDILKKQSVGVGWIV